MCKSVIRYFATVKHQITDLSWTYFLQLAAGGYSVLDFIILLAAPEKELPNIEFSWQPAAGGV